MRTRYGSMMVAPGEKIMTFCKEHIVITADIVTTIEPQGALQQLFHFEREQFGQKMCNAPNLSLKNVERRWKAL